VQVKQLFERWKVGFLIYFWVYLAWALAGFVLALPLLILMFMRIPLGEGFGSFRLFALVPIIIAPFVVTSDTFLSIIRDLVERSNGED
jgi:uncharacterized membrane protein